ncbi:MAG: hypothetical protein GX554_04980 [Elusimicrobia bacterium]|nr:hypothetical protein [Elusimicrobiota bacterium]
MERNKRDKKSSGKGKLTKIVLVIICLAVIGAGVNFYINYIEEQKRLKELAEKQRQEELDLERQRKFMEEKQLEFDRLVAEMKRYYEAGDFAKAREIAQRALELANQYGFNTDEIYRILRLMDIAEYTQRLKELEKLNEDIYKYSYVREEVNKIPSMAELESLKTRIRKKTYLNEYMVNLILAKENAVKGMEAENPLYYYLISRDYLDKAMALRTAHGFVVSSEEDAIRIQQRELFFYSEKIKDDTIPSTL